MSDVNLPPKPKARAVKVSLRQYVKLFRKDILSAHGRPNFERRSFDPT